MFKVKLLLCYYYNKILSVFKIKSTKTCKLDVDCSAYVYKTGTSTHFLNLSFSSTHSSVCDRARENHKYRVKDTALL